MIVRKYLEKAAKNPPTVWDSRIKWQVLSKLHEAAFPRKQHQHDTYQQLFSCVLGRMGFQERYLKSFLDEVARAPMDDKPYVYSNALLDMVANSIRSEEGRKNRRKRAA